MRTREIAKTFDGISFFLSESEIMVSQIGLLLQW